MSFFLQYLLKISFTLAVLYVFYRAVLRPLTFYQWNRFYLLCYSLLSFLIPLINITSWVQWQSMENKRLFNVIPSLDNYTIASAQWATRDSSVLARFNISDWGILLFTIGVIAMMVRLVIQYLSLRRIRRKAILFSIDSNVHLFETRALITPFSFGNCIYLNPTLHSEEELQRIVQHEFIHVKQKHTFDLLVGEILCILNWYNPFAWLIRSSIRQNLEFIADNKVVENGLDRKEYQYLLLKVVGIRQYSIVTNFNFSNLKKRIIMMNKMKSDKLQLAKFLFVLPLLAVLLFAFQNRSHSNHIAGNKKSIENILFRTDTVPPPAPPAPPVPSVPQVKKPKTIYLTVIPPAPLNSKGNRIEIINNHGQPLVIVKDKNKREIKRLLLSAWNNKQTYYESLYGEIPSPPEIVPVQPSPPDAVIIQDTIQNVFREKVEITSAKPVTTVMVVTRDKIATVIDKKVPVRQVKMVVEPATARYAHPPLFVIDGQVQPSGFNVNQINANEIESINVLKDEKATRLYGDKGKNGVILISKKIHEGPSFYTDTLMLKADTIIIHK